ncbi:DMT family transporter [uncultured Shimia sp.]|uniref:DMT family transporter n=1 Tax=uncultured Shimia sp. TaxID=573152 RepID=UPI00261A754E|nr:DMT family transporter [uncultured Shimia sp.]
MNPIRGIALKLISVLLFSIMASCIKAASAHVPPGEAVFFRSIFALPVIFGWLLLRRELRTGLKTDNVMGHFWRGVIGTTAMALGFSALGLLSLPEVTAIGYAAPLLVVVFAAMFLGEQVRLFRLSAVGLGLLGVMIVLYPRLSSLSGENRDAVAALGAVLTLGSATFMALAQIHIRRLVQTEKTSAIVFYFTLSSALLSLLTLPFGWVMPTGYEALLLVAAGLLGGIAQIFLTSAYRFAPASTVAPFDYASMLLAIVIGYFIFAETPTIHTLAGAALIICAGVLIIWRERQLGLKRGARKTLTPQG